jgi:hypothetical protein
MLQVASKLKPTAEYTYIDINTLAYAGLNYNTSPFDANTSNATSSSTVVSEIVIVGHRPEGWPTTNLPVGSIAFDDGYFGIFRNLPDGTPNPYFTYQEPNDHIISIDVSAANTPAAVQTLLRLAPAVALLSHKVSFIGETQQITTSFGQVRTGEVQSIWNEINIKIVDSIAGTASADAAMVWSSQPDGTYGPTMLITPNILNTYAGPGFADDTGVNYLLTHEIGHMTTPGNQAFNTYFSAYLSVGGQNTVENWNNEPANPWREQVEHIVNNVGINIAIYLGLPVYTTPTYEW